MKQLLLIVLCVIWCSTTFSQSDESKRTAFQLSFVTPLGTNGQLSSQYTNKVSFNILVGISENEEAFTFGGLSNIILNNAKGFQFAGLSNHVGNDGRGLQFAGVANVNKNSFTGLQFAGLINTARDTKGFQFAGLSNIAKDVKGFQFAGLSNHVGNNGRGLQFAGLANVNKNSFTGLQFAGLINTARDTKGFQFAGLSNHVGNNGQGFQFAGVANMNKNSFTGFQFAGLINTARDTKGFQFAGLSNIAEDVKGSQFAGLINIAKNVDGFQFAGLVNIAENSNCPIGLVNIIKNGEKSIAVTYDAIGSTVLSFRSGGKYTYGIIGVGYNHKTEGNSLMTECGLGVHIPVVEWFRINNELKFSSIGIDSDEPVLNSGYSLIPAFKIGSHCELFAGVSVNYMETENMDNDKIFPNHSLWEKNSATKLQQIYIGYQVGVQYIF